MIDKNCGVLALCLVNFIRSAAEQITGKSAAIIVISGGLIRSKWIIYSYFDYFYHLERNKLQLIELFPPKWLQIVLIEEISRYYPLARLAKLGSTNRYEFGRGKVQAAPASENS